ncbi:acetyl-CoA carboxylase biotin carboxylase subunit [Pseudonocardia sulfidoxydans NBRC 16205]|uniref:biotin carboxylase n=1 Tax=Pseudonocardia sulfidoxydans NBRC 16205 TaxID=1223511 RepID=A0A511DFB8_9PSEU|nr:biotin carboxylase N-terminal domain-containing protein [Pseudonocardia sulfidoxydans]GEL23479.1 acetyl-CoA carboxylase biotin carboxylase subunit [Pseudonocardia sulfidoxydans NBRC 16205]
MASPALSATQVEARPLRRVLVANRGEIAVRVVKACRSLGIESVVVTSTVDRDGMAARLADRAVCIGPPSAGQSYLAIPSVLSAALGTGCDAVHPGYGFLSENPEFAAACVNEGLTFVGPRPEAVAQAGDKARARELARTAGIPTLDGSPILETTADAVAAADALGYPVLVKAAAGGGGRGMSVVEDEAQLRSRFVAAAEEARSAFGDGRVYLERFVRNARHIEVQVLGDKHGTVVHVGERDCTLQRRHQKVVEESPAPNIPDDVRRDIRRSGVAFARALELDSAGTVEFIYDADSSDETGPAGSSEETGPAGSSDETGPAGRQPYAFLEFNARIQVEHPVSELVSGIDLVAAQLRVAGGAPLGFTQDDVEVTGHAVEVRITTEDPARGFVPHPGTVSVWEPPTGEGIRVDSHCEPGYVVTPYYDSLLAKIIAFGPDRDTAIDRMLAALDALRVEGVPTTREFCRAALDHPDFRAGRVTTNWIAEHGLPHYLETRR